MESCWCGTRSGEAGRQAVQAAGGLVGSVGSASLAGKLACEQLALPGSCVSAQTVTVSSVAPVCLQEQL